MSLAWQSEMLMSKDVTEMLVGCVRWRWMAAKVRARNGREVGHLTSGYRLELCWVYHLKMPISQNFGIGIRLHWLDISLDNHDRLSDCSTACGFRIMWV